jgi:hypothetical protein
VFIKQPSHGILQTSHYQTATPTPTSYSNTYFNLHHQTTQFIFTMDKAKAAVSDFMKKSGHHDTTVHETVAPAVQHEEVKAHNHENVTTAVDKEVHQDHYHRTVQPVQDREVLPEQHHHKLGAVQHREFDNRDHQAVKQNLAAEQAGFKDEQVVHDATHSQAAAPTVGGEHVHHVSLLDCI